MTPAERRAKHAAVMRASRARTRERIEAERQASRVVPPLPEDFEGLDFRTLVHSLWPSIPWVTPRDRGAP